jgi:hypothetical protein
MHWKVCTDAAPAAYSGASPVVLDVHGKRRALAALYGCHDLAVMIQALR